MNRTCLARTGLALVFVLLLPGLSFAQVIPASRMIDWSQSGIPGGIPNRTTICSNIAAGANRTTIQNALNACPAGQVVKLAAGTYNISGSLTVPSDVTLRGAGPQQTILSASGSGSGFILLGPGTTPVISNSTAITGGTGAGSTSIVVSSSTGVSVGSYLLITQLNDPTYVYITTTNGSCTFCDGGIGWNGTRVQGQIVEVTSVSGNNIGISPGLYLPYTLTPLATKFSMAAKYAGVEDLQVFMNNTGFVANFRLEGAAYSWVKNVESNYTDGDHVQVHWGYRNEIRDSFIHDGYTHSPGSTESDIFLVNKTSGTLVENNAMRRQHVSIILNWGAAGNVIAYNYMDNNFDSTGINTMFEGLNTHGAHPMFNLWEGNIASKLNPDYYWGTSSHNTAFRNWFKGVQEIIPPLTGRAPEQPGSTYWASQALSAVDLAQTSRFYNLLGNVIGTARQKTVGTWTPQVVTPQTRCFYCGNTHFGYTFGYANLSDTGGDSGNNTQPFTTALIHGDYDFVLSTFRWDPGTSNRNLNPSLYLSSKPNWFGSLAWPAFGPLPTDSTTVVVGNIPAKHCFDQGLMPTCVDGTTSCPAL